MNLFWTWLANYVRASSSSFLFCIQPSLKLFYLLYSGLFFFPFISCLQNLPFFMIMLPPNIWIFPVFLAVITTDKPVNRSIHAYALTQLNFFALRGFIFPDIHKIQGRSLSNSGYKIQKNVWLENILVHTHHWRGSTQIGYSSQKMAQQV